MGARFVDRVSNPSKLSPYSVKSIGGTMKTIKAAILAAMIVGGTSCGGGSVPVSTVKASSSKAYSITINGASSSVQLSTTIVVTVK